MYALQDSKDFRQLWDSGIKCYKNNLFYEASDYFRSSLSMLSEKEGAEYSTYRIQININIAMCLKQVGSANNATFFNHIFLNQSLISVGRNERRG